jgi:hypothetical protein
MSSVKDELAAAVCAENPTERLSEVVRGLVSQGQQRGSIYAELEKLRTTLQKIGRDEAEDAVLEVMDFLTGWCSPHMKI